MTSNLTTACLVAAMLVASCGDVSTPSGLDRAADHLPVQALSSNRPRFPALDAATVSVPSYLPSLPAGTASTLALQRAFFSGDFDRVEAALSDAHDRYLAGVSEVLESRPFARNIMDTQLAGLGACADWLAERPGSYWAHWVCASVWRAGALAARTEKRAADVSPAQFALMRERLARSIELLERALSLTATPLEALAVLAANHSSLGDREGAAQYLARAESLMPAYPPIHEIRVHDALPKWGGSMDIAQAALDKARAVGIGADDLVDLEDMLADPQQMSTPGATQNYWEEALDTRPTRKRLAQFTHYLIWVENWTSALSIADRRVQEHPDDSSAWFDRARIHERLGATAPARSDYTKAAAMGHDRALERLILAHLRGGLGIVERSVADASALCWHAAGLGSAVAANCIGSLYLEAPPGSGIVKADLGQALAWHLLAARGGHYNSQYDLGWLLYSGRSLDMPEDRAKQLGVFWLRRAAEQNHEYARRKLRENSISPSEPDSTHSFGLEAVRSILGAVWTYFSRL